MVSLQHWLLKFGAASLTLRQILGEFGDWMVNRRPPWSAYRAMALGRFIELDKCPGVQPVGIGETWRRLLEKCVSAVIGAEAKEVYGMEQLCGGL